MASESCSKFLERGLSLSSQLSCAVMTRAVYSSIGTLGVEISLKSDEQHDFNELHKIRLAEEPSVRSRRRDYAQPIPEVGSHLRCRVHLRVIYLPLMKGERASCRNLWKEYYTISDEKQSNDGNHRKIIRWTEQREARKAPPQARDEITPDGGWKGDTFLR